MLLRILGISIHKLWDDLLRNECNESNSASCLLFGLEIRIQVVSMYF